MSKEYLGQVFISNQFVHFIYIGEGRYLNTVNLIIQDRDELKLAAMPNNYRIYEAS